LNRARLRCTQPAVLTGAISNNSKKAKGDRPKEEEVDVLPTRRSYDIILPKFIVQGLLSKNKVYIPLKELQLKLVIDSKKQHSQFYFKGAVQEHQFRKLMLGINFIDSKSAT
jgi:hypothetical protein